MMAEADTTFDPNRNYDDESMSLQRAIEKQIADTQDLIGPCQTIDELVEEYAKEDQVYRQKLEDLKKRYSHIRKVRGDGNCFFRGFGFAYLESLLNDPEEFKRFIGIAEKSKDDLLALGFPQFTIEDFHETFMDVAGQAGKNMTVEELQQCFNDQGLSDYFVVYLRLIVSGHLQKEADFYNNFIEGGRTAKEFCGQEVEPMGKESDHIHIIALSSVLGTAVLVEYMDRGGDTSCNQVVVPEGGRPAVRLLYRPGHYDILYSNNQ
ncbi:ubiquitin thioesterase OTUB1-like [Babylonia areolata]|uniref:ubiquitin thioesterase OTUB1-like n=1 Tax=Babylonia areolata TaxID=304850 RepID=UPI003FD5A56B